MRNHIWLLTIFLCIIYEARAKNLEFKIEESKIDSVEKLILMAKKGGDSSIILDEVIISAGYFKLPKERMTGSFSLLDQNLLSRNNSRSLLQRLDGITEGILIDKRSTRGDETTNGINNSDIRIRGLGTIFASTAPLIVVNGFPYNGLLEDIEPELVENIVVLKDAAANSIWGARAGNGVIVITLKNYSNQSSLYTTFKSTLSISEKPDLFYNRGFLTSDALIEYERFAFQQNMIIEDPIRPLSPVIELLISHRDGKISNDELQKRLMQIKTLDIRKEAKNKLYRNSTNQHYNLNVGGRLGDFGFQQVLSYNNNKSSLRETLKDHLVYNTLANVNLFKNITLETNLLLTYGTQTNNGIGMYSTTDAGSNIFYPYSQLSVDGVNQSAKPIYRENYVNDAINNGLLDWRYYPLDEVKLNESNIKSTSINLTSSIQYAMNFGLKANIFYNYQYYRDLETKINDQNSYKVRNLVNRFTQSDGSKKFPIGDMMEDFNQYKKSQSVRIQFSLDKEIINRLNLSAIGGAEIREEKTKVGLPHRIIGLNQDVLTYDSFLDFSTYWPTNPFGQYSRLDAPVDLMQDLTDRYVSYFVNANLRLIERLNISGSARWDASNLIGVDFRNRGVPLWSSGLKYLMLENEKVGLSGRLTYGVSGNLHPTATALPVVYYGIDSNTGFKTASLSNPGNRDLRWEKIKISNIGVDFRFSNWLNGVVEGFIKDNVDLVGSPLLDPTSGISTVGGAYMSNYVNYANLKTWGADMRISTNYLFQMLNWRTDMHFSYTENKIKKYNSNPPSNVLPYLNSNLPTPMEGYSRDVMYAIPWNGLGIDDGFPIIYINGEESRNYGAYFNGLNYTDLKKVGSSIPKFIGGFRNTILIPKINFDMSLNITWKAGYKFRERSIEYPNLMDSYFGHTDFMKRWRVSGDELNTYVPAIPLTVDRAMDNVYKYAEVHIKDASHIRLNDIQVGYNYKNNRKEAKVKSIRFNFMLTNIGIIWKNGSYQTDPDYPYAQLLPSKNYSFSTQLIF